MPILNDNYLKLAAGYLFPEIARRIDAFAEAHPVEARDLIRCGIGDVTEPIPAVCVAALKRGADELGDRASFRGYPPATGYDFVRELIATNDFAARGASITPDEIFLSDGSKGDCGSILELFGAGNRIAVTNPVYPVYVDTNVMAGNTGCALDDGSYEGLHTIEANEANGFVPPPPTIPIDLVYLCFPNNPTGAMITRPQLEQWVEWALANDAIIFYDAAYAAFIRDTTLPHTIYEIDGADRCAIEFHSFSKNGGFTGLRAGYSVVPKALMGSTASGERIPLHRLWTRRWATRSNGVSWPVQRAVEALYSKDGVSQVTALIDHYMANARLLLEGCSTLGLRTFGGEHAPYVWVTCPEGIDSWGLFDRLLTESLVVTTPGAGFGRCGEGYIRISAFNSRANVVRVVERLATLAF